MESESDEYINKQMASEYETISAQFDFGFIIIGLIAFFALYAGIRCFSAEEEKTAAVKKEDPRKKILSFAEVRRHDGSEPDLPIYVALNGYVFDVTSSDNYKKGGSYEVFAGHEISMACANYSTDSEFLDEYYDPQKTIIDTNKEQNIISFYMNFCSKYEIVGKLDLDSIKKDK